MTGKSILLIDDDAYLLEVIQDYLEAKGFVVHTARDGLQAHPLASSRKPSLIILDVDMPHTNGLKALQQLRKDPKTENIPVILLTGMVSASVFPSIQNMPR